MPRVQTSHPAESVAGTICLVAGAALGLLVLAVRIDDSWLFPAGLIRRNPVLVCGFSVALLLCGSRLLWRTRNVSTVWVPSRPGRRFHTATFYHKQNCPLCEEAEKVLSSYQQFLPPIQILDVDERPDLQQRYATCVPVLELDGRRRFVGQINEVLLRRLLEGTPPATDGS